MNVYKMSFDTILLMKSGFMHFSAEIMISTIYSLRVVVVDYISTVSIINRRSIKMLILELISVMIMLLITSQVIAMINKP